MTDIVDLYAKFQGYVERYGGIFTKSEITQKLNNKVDKVTGKGLSTNDYTNQDKLKVGEINDKVDKITGKGLSTNDYTNADKAKVGEIDNKVDKITGKGLSTNDFTNNCKNKLEGLENFNIKLYDENAAKNELGLGPADSVLEFSWGVRAQDTYEIAGVLVECVKNGRVVSYGVSLKEGLYRYTDGHDFDELAYKSENGRIYVFNEKLVSTINKRLNSKVDKVEGKGLSTNDFTNELKTKLDGIETGATRTIVDSELDDESTNPVQNSVIKQALDITVSDIGNLFNHQALSVNFVDFDDYCEFVEDAEDDGITITGVSHYLDIVGWGRLDENNLNWLYFFLDENGTVDSCYFVKYNINTSVNQIIHLFTNEDYLTENELLPFVNVEVSNMTIADLVATAFPQAPASQRTKETLLQLYQNAEDPIADTLLDVCNTNRGVFLKTNHHIINLEGEGIYLFNPDYANIGNLVTTGTITKIHDNISQEDIDNKVDKVEGKGLSTNDYTNEDKSKVGEIDNKVDATDLEVLPITITYTDESTETVNVYIEPSS